MRSATGRPPSFGISLPNRGVLLGLPVERLLETAERAEASGAFDSVWVGESLVTLAAIAARTRRVKLGTICLASFPHRHPVALAIQWASLDVLSGGRTILAVCNGKGKNDGPLALTELATMGVGSNERAPRVEEGIELLRRLWGPEPVTFQGRFYTLDDVVALPKPIQGRVPIVLAINPPLQAEPALVARMLRRVARLADGWQTDATPPAAFRERWSQVREYAAEYGRADQVTHASLHLMVNINDDAAQARRESVEFLDRYYGVGDVSEEKLKVWLAYGPPSAVIECIGQYLEAGCTTPVLRFTSLDQVGQLERCVRDVLPAFRGATVAAV
jgi:alkanesulfonate monooxygenase SsuD/methylene tetrahydromethanopterin reductase-like flavin-dependent oxidoreductase (luciferase family)